MAVIVDVVFHEFSIVADQGPRLVQDEFSENPQKRTEFTFKMGSRGIFERVFPGHGYQTGVWVFNLVHVVPLERSKPRLVFVF